MPTATDPTLATVTQTKEQVLASSGRLAHLLTFVPDDRLVWSPSSTTRSAIRIVAHCALVNSIFARILSGTMPEPMPSPERFFEEMHADEMKAFTRDELFAMLSKSIDELTRAIGAVDAEAIDAPVESPFGPIPARFWLAQSAEHLVAHAGQMTYLQTIWGDMDNHMG